MAGSPISDPVTKVSDCFGKWIWCKGEAKPYHFFLLARGSFDLAEKPATTRMHVSASDRYWVYVNGIYLGRGPARSHPRLKSYDTYDVTEHLRAGKNTIAIRAYYYGKPPHPQSSHANFSAKLHVPPVPANFPVNYYTYGERAGLWAQLEVTNPRGESIILGTDDSWRFLPAKGWNRDVLRIKGKGGITEVYDASIDPVDWMETDSQDSDWEKAEVIPWAERPWMNMEARYTPLMLEQEISPVRVVEAGEVINDGLGTQTGIPELLNAEIHLPLETALVKNTEALLRRDDRSADFQSQFIEGKGIHDPYVILDFGRQLFGFPRIKLNAEKGAILDMTYGQQLIGGRIPPVNPDYGRWGDRYIARDGKQTWELSLWKQFRYLHITFRSLYSPIRVESVSINQYAYPAKQRGRFECSDPCLNKLWQAAVDTTYLQMEDTIVCDACRERVAHAQVYSINAINGVYMAFGDLELTDRKLRVTPLAAFEDGMIEMKFPADAKQRTITNGGCMWCNGIRRHYLYTGRRAVMEELYPTMQHLIDWYESYRDEMGLLGQLPPRMWVDWAPNDIRGAVFINNALYIKGLEDAAWLADQVDRAEDAKRWRMISEEVRSTLRRIFWNKEKGLYEDSYYHGSLTGITSEQANGLALLYDIATEEQVALIASNLSGLNEDLVQASPLTIGYVLDGLMKRGSTKIALDLIRKRFAYMLDFSDHPTLWENWGPYNRGANITSDIEYSSRRPNQVEPHPGRSLVHCSGVLAGYVLTTRVLGVFSTGPGFTKCIIHPNPGDLEWAKGIIPTPQGNIKIEWKIEREKPTLKMELPVGVEAEIVLDRDPGKKQTLYFDGSEFELDSKKGSLPEGLDLEREKIRLRVSDGTHSIYLRML